ncbi:SNF5-domain-containing protein [Trametopsis cervina]|nr:SNF5-domain-containing protein [Trametopsis cervina]
MSGAAAGSSFQNVTDAQLRSQISATIAGSQTQRPTPTPVYLNNIRQWSHSVTPPPTNGRSNPSRKARATKGSSLAPTPTTQNAALPRVSVPPVASTSQAQGLPRTHPQNSAPYPPRTSLPTATQALHTTYPSRLRTGVTLLMQPIFASASSTAAATRTTRRGGIVNYADPGSGDEFPDAGAIDSEDSDFMASGGTRAATRSARLSSRAPVGAGVFSAGGATMIMQAPQPSSQPQRNEIDQSYLGMVPPSRFITPKAAPLTKLQYYPPDALEMQARRTTALIPIRVEFETETHRIRDCFVWNLTENLITPEMFAQTFCMDLDLPPNPWVETIANQIRAQIEDHESVAAVDFDLDALNIYGPGEDEVPECRVILSIDVQIATYHLTDHIEWDLLSPLTPETFAMTLCADLGLSGEAVPLVAHAIHEELIKHKRDAIEWGVIGGETQPVSTEDHPRDRSGFSLLKDKTGLGLSWGRAPRDGRGPKPLRSVWRDWAEAEEFRTRFEVLSAEEVERREIERERSTRRLRRETSKFQSQAASRRRR